MRRSALDELPLFADDRAIGQALLGTARAAEWQKIVPIYERRGFPAIDPNMRTAYTLSWNGTIERELGGRFVIGASYLGSSGSRLYSVFRVNRWGSGGLLDPNCITTRFAADGTTPLGPDYTNCPGLNPEVSDLRLRTNGSHSSFEALQLRVDSRRLQRWGIEVGVNYTWSHALDTCSNTRWAGS